MPTLSRILLIDDDAVDRQAVRRALTASDLQWELTEAGSGAEGLELARGTRFDCVLLDYRLPGVDTFELLAELVSPDAGPQAVMMLTGEGDPDIAIRLMRTGALDHLAKGEMTPQTLARAIRYAKARRGFLGEIEEKTAALEELNRQKSLLLSIIAHDLRNPFQIMLGMSETLSRAVADKDPAKIELRAQGIRHAAEQAHRLMEDLFRWAELQMNTADVVLDDLDLGALAEGAIAPCRETAKRKGITLEIACDGRKALAHPDMLSTILRNLVANAIKFTGEGGRVLVTAAEDGGAVRLEVQDTGIGMSGETVDRLFRPEERVTTTGTAGEKGSGLGLLLCRDLADRLGTELAVDSAPGQGTVFSLALDKAEAGASSPS